MAPRTCQLTCAVHVAAESAAESAGGAEPDLDRRWSPSSELGAEEAPPSPTPPPAPWGMMRVEHTDAEGRVGVTEVRIVTVTPCSVYGALTTLDLRPLTGRRHQLRIACALGLGAPIVGDDLYHDAANAARTVAMLPTLPPVRRRAGLFLQALELSLPHPVTGEVVSASAPEMARFAKLRERAASGAGFSNREWETWRS